jgi:methyl-accepting chemotaxis protein|tara:strand:+ start:879 stop:2891 length:2013 start_codon:yes stop_codon:yes gene_type:complete
MQLTVVRKLILGFLSLSCLLAVMNGVSYLGLSNIQQSAESVVEQKMPAQSKMLAVQTGLLSLAKVSTNGYFLNNTVALANNRATFRKLAEVFEKQLSELNGLLLADNKGVFANGKQQSLLYLQQSSAMYQSKSNQLDIEQTIVGVANDLVNLADEASALMQDLAYVESENPNVNRLIGTGTSIDNKLTPLINGIPSFVKITTQAQSQPEQDALEYNLSNIEVDADFLNHLAQDIDTDGLIELFNTQFILLKKGLTSADGLFVIHQSKLESIVIAAQQRETAEAALEQAIEVFGQLFNSVNQDTLKGQKDILDSAQANIITGLVIMILALALAFFIGVYVARSIAVPLARINRSLSVLESGDLTHHAWVIGNDEFTTLATSVNKLSESLHQVVTQIYQQETLLDDAASTSVKLGERTLLQVAKQQEQVNLTSQNTDSVRATSQTNLSQIHYAMKQLANVAKQSDRVGSLVGQSKDQVIAQSQQAQESSSIINRLEGNSKNVSSILDVIKSIADQTNLLALNAAIEAARAGEQGRGFAVVADEVRSLATKTQQSTQEIETVIVSLQKDAAQAVKAMMLGSEQSQESVSLIEQVSDEVVTIGRVINDLTAINQEIVNDTNAQDGLLNTVAESLQTIVELAQQSAESTVQSNQATQKIDELTAKLKNAVSRFKL